LKPTAIVIGAGFSGIAAAASLARRGFTVDLVEKNNGAGGRASVWRQNGFTFDMGPSFYWMPEVFERFFAEFGERAADHYDLRRLDPSYKVVFSPQ
jgi:phytoene desaturase